MNDQMVITDGDRTLVPLAEKGRMATASLRGYTYQIVAAALAWLDLPDKSLLFLEVAEDYAVVARDAINAVQVKDTEQSGTVTLNTGSIKDAVSNYMSLKAANPNSDVQLRYFTTSEIGTEQSVADRPGGIAGLDYWRKAAAGADVTPLRQILESDKFSKVVQDFVRARDDDALRKELISRIHWDCGQPDLTALQSEFEDRLIVLGRDKFNIPVDDAKRVSQSLIYKVLQTSVLQNPNDRSLSLAQLYIEIESQGSITLQRSQFDKITAFTGQILAAFVPHGTELSVRSNEDGWIIDGNDLPESNLIVSRSMLETAMIDCLRQFGVGIAVGASGLGKSSLAKVVAMRESDRFFIVDFRQAGTEEARLRLNMIVSRIGGLDASIFIFEDLNCLDDPRIKVPMARVLQALRRRDRRLILTCYSRPTFSVLSSLGVELDCIVECPYFTREEVATFVKSSGGNPVYWTGIAYASGAFGHPRLTQAFVAGMAARGWQTDEINDIVSGGFSTGDVVAERDAARRALVDCMPEPTRNLLYRLSLTIGSFNRALALSIANSSPPIARAGECIDFLIGPWLEIVGRDSYRISPLVAGSGAGMLSTPEKESIHSAIATKFVSSRVVNGSDIDAILFHAIQGKNLHAIAGMTRSILTSDIGTTEKLAENLTMFKLYAFDRPLYPENRTISSLLRLTQFKVLAVDKEQKKITACAAALISETNVIQDKDIRAAQLSVVYSLVLGTMGIANYLENWIGMLKEFQNLIATNDFLETLQGNFENGGEHPLKMLGVLFAAGSAGLSSVERLENLINELDGVGHDHRLVYLSTIAEISPDYSVLIDSAWTSEDKKQTLNGLDAAERYQRMACIVENWQLESLAIQCWIARSIMLDEYAGHAEEALEVLKQAIDRFGENISILRASAKIYWRAQDHKNAFPILRRIANIVGKENPSEFAYAIREAAISAANCDEWEHAEQWFLEAKVAATKSAAPETNIMAIGLGADAAVAAFKLGKSDRAILGFFTALSALEVVDPRSSIRACHSHHVIRHSITWAKSQLESRQVEIHGQPLGMIAGCCSNPDPSNDFFDRPLVSLDIAWYMLASFEVKSGQDVGVAEILHKHLSGGQIPVLEVGLRSDKLVRCVLNTDVDNFLRHLWSHIEGYLYLSANKEKWRVSFNPINPEYSDVPSIPRTDISEANVSQLAYEAVNAFIISAICQNRRDTLPMLFERLGTELNFSSAKSNAWQVQFNLFVTQYLDTKHPRPEIAFRLGVQFFACAKNSNFRSTLVPLVASWHRDVWNRIVELERFNLVRPQETVPAIMNVLNMSLNDLTFLSLLIPAASTAVGVVLQKEILRSMNDISDR